ncbi:MAG TPA: zf-HC2 domain-containing protein [Pyrinomonadaceae bacterium]
MRQETNNEMDLLLRRLGRQDTAAPDDHLDADELNSYAENALPPAARVRYTEHLAECARCRDLVVQLSSSAGVLVAQETAKVSEPSWLSKFLASLFSPMVLRYAVPALGLVIVAAIGVVVLRNEGTVNYAPVAERREEAQPAQGRVAVTQPSSSPEETRPGFTDTAKSVNKSAAPDNTGAATGAAAPPPPNAAPIVSITTEVQDAAKKVEQQRADTKEAPAPKPTPTTEDLKKADADERKQPAENAVVVANEPAAEKAKSQETKAATDAAAASPASARSRDDTSLSALGGVATRRARREDAGEKDQDEAVIRTVAGRRFRKQGNVWIDTDHSSSRVVTSVARGSEQYRALVADEPSIKQIADALDGEIIVVWKGRAYRIR